ncbi:uncharacterized protein LOC124436183 isoform X2 [Xenia sp. Carnegie-2017]|uniref:uncharacterized protein LOC124436183 isoform X2 n=1 Tax=Xenia sp. Carnegie-2017 TaxID=2897299 RepID=UPI001F044B75|nr:uncharacterized protein LOC124436183 isoform X2 [Xenia sp. Carnegie-2017]
MARLFVFLLVRVSLVLTLEKISASKAIRRVEMETVEQSQESISRTKRSTNRKKSYIFFDNRSGKTAKLYWRDVSSSGRPTYFTKILPKQAVTITSRTVHEWTARDNQGRSMIIGNGTRMVPVANTETTKSIFFIKNQGQKTIEDEHLYVEVFVVMDKSAAAMHRTEREAQKYVTTLFRLATEIYQHKDLSQHGIKIHLALAKLLVLRRDVNEVKLQPRDEKNALLKACRYMNNIGNSDGRRYDHKLFITRQKFGRAGYAHLRGMCSQNYSCSIVNDYGFKGSFIIAHEIAHGFALTDKPFGRNSGFVMSEIVDCGLGRCGWSQQSQVELLTYFRSFGCVRNKPRLMPNLPFVHKYPGVDYSLSRQCQLHFDEDYIVKIRRDRDPCANLECRMPPPKTEFSRPIKSQPLDGTECGHNKWCMSGNCRVKPISHTTQTKYNPEVVTRRKREGWGDWGKWSQCSRTCNRGVQIRRRLCTTRSLKNMNKVCVGSSWEVKTCDTSRACPIGDKDGACAQVGARSHPGRKWKHNDNLNRLDCSFEKDKCSWTDVVRSGFKQWTLRKGRTPSRGTGPSVDYTLKTNKGQYVYFESSTRSTAQAELRSPLIKYREMCFSFSYHMWGDGNMGQLKLVKESGRVKTTLWRMLGNRRNRWHRHTMNIRTTTAYRLSFHAKKEGSSYKSDIAIDDIDVKLGACSRPGQRKNTKSISTSCQLSCKTVDNQRPAKVMTGVKAFDGAACSSKTIPKGVCYKGVCKNIGCGSVLTNGASKRCTQTKTQQQNVNTQSGTRTSNDNRRVRTTARVTLQRPRTTASTMNYDRINCNFNRNFCNWRNMAPKSRQNVYGNELNWFRQRQKRKGYYLRLRHNGKGGIKIGSIISPEITEPTACLMFDYRLNRKGGYGRMRVKLAKKFSKMFHASTKKFLTRSPKWKKERIEIRSERTYKIIFEATLSRSYTGKIAVDNIRFQRGKCAQIVG